MTKNKIIDIKIIFKTYLKYFEFQIDFYYIKYYKTIFKNCL